MKTKLFVLGLVGVGVIAAGVFVYRRMNQISGGYMAVGQNGVELLAVTQGNGGTLTGTLYDASLNGDHVSQEQQGIQGQYNNGYITMSLDGVLGRLFGENISGHKSGDTIKLMSNGSSSVLLTRATMNDYDQQVSILQQQANKVLAAEQAKERAQQQTQAALAQQQQVQQKEQDAVDNAAGTVDTDINNLGGDISSMGGDVSSMGGDLSSQGGDVSSAGGDLSTAQADHQDGSDMSGDVATMQSDIQTQMKDFQNLKTQDLGKTLAQDESKINADIAQINNDYDVYQQVSQEYNMTASMGAPDIQSAIQNARSTLAQYHSTENSYLTQSQQDIATVQGYALQVQQMAK